jgi:hypothetical protein
MNYEQKFATPHAVYRIYDAKNRLLYVGCSKNPVGNRLRQHGEEKGWYQEVAFIKVQWFPGWVEAAAEEMEAIYTEKPLYNAALPTPTSSRIRDKPERFKGETGRRCPKCDTPIQDLRPGKAYCNVCYREYTRARRQRIAQAKLTNA